MLTDEALRNSWSVPVACRCHLHPSLNDYIISMPRQFASTLFHIYNQTVVCEHEFVTAFSQAYGVEGALGWTLWSHFHEMLAIHKTSFPLTLARVHCCPQGVQDRDVGLQCSRLGANTRLFHLCQEVNARYCAAQNEDCGAVKLPQEPKLVAHAQDTLPMAASLPTPLTVAGTTRTLRERNIGMCHPEAIRGA